MAHSSPCGGDPAERDVCPHCGAQAAADAGGNPYAIGSQVQPNVFDRDDAAPEIPGFSRALRICFLEKYFSPFGRASRSEYWYCVAGVLIVTFVALHLFAFICDNFVEDSSRLVSLGALFGILFGIFIFLPLLGVTIRRQHDVGLPGWFFVLIFCITIGLVLHICRLDDTSAFFVVLAPFGVLSVYAVACILLFLAFLANEPLSLALSCLFLLVNIAVFCWPGMKGPNRYGPAPKKREKTF